MTDPTKDELAAGLADDDGDAEETTTEKEREENARATADRENQAAELHAGGPRPPRRRRDRKG